MRLSVGDKALFFRQLTVMLNAAVPLVTALNTLKNQMGARGRLNRLLISMGKDIQEGHSLQQAMSEFPQDFSPFVLKMIEAGEKGGDLPGILDKLAREEEQRREFYAKITAELTYPLLVIALSIFILPLPLLFSPNRGSELYFASLAGALIPLGIVIFIIIFGYFFLLPNPIFRAVWQTFWSHVPLLGSLLKQQGVMIFLQTYAYLYGAGVPNSEAFKTAAASQGNWWIKNQLERALPTVKQSYSLSESLRPLSGLFPPAVKSLIVAGETSGEVPEMLLKSAQIMQLELESRSKLLFKLASILLFLGIGAYVGFKVIGYYQNLFKGLFSL